MSLLAVAVAAAGVLTVVWLLGSVPAVMLASAIPLAIALAGLALGCRAPRAHAEVPEAQARSPIAEAAEFLLERASVNAITAADVSYAVDRMLRSTISQARECREIAAATESIAATIESTAGNAAEARSLALQVSYVGEKGLTRVQGVIGQMDTMRAQSQETLQTMEQLQQVTDRIRSITDAISSIAAQTNLLALNAAIEAARAGEAGRGFAVVADEVRSLSVKTSSATEEIGDMVGRIQVEAEKAATTTQRFVREVNEWADAVGQLGQQLGDIRGAAVTMEVQVNAIADDTERNHQEIGQIVRSVLQIREQMDGSEQAMTRISEQTMGLSDIAEAVTSRLADHAPDSDVHRIYTVARTAADAVQSAFEQALDVGRLSDTDLFDRHHKPITGTNPVKYKTRYDALTDQVLPPIQEPILKAYPDILFAIVTDPDGYVPTHNTRYAQPLTGDYERDLTGNRTKRIFNDRTGLRCGSHRERMLLQTYKRDTGEIMHDLSVPIFVKGRHWGGFRVGYRAAG